MPVEVATDVDLGDSRPLYSKMQTRPRLVFEWTKLLLWVFVSAVCVWVAIQTEWSGYGVLGLVVAAMFLTHACYRILHYHRLPATLRIYAEGIRWRGEGGQEEQFIAAADIDVIMISEEGDWFCIGVRHSDVLRIVPSACFGDRTNMLSSLQAAFPDVLIKRFLDEH